MSAALWFRGGDRLPANIALSLIPSLPRPTLERLVQRLIDGLDDMDPDSDLEPNGDEDDTSRAEDDFFPPPFAIDGEDIGVIILPCERGEEPTRYRVT